MNLVFKTMEIYRAVWVCMNLWINVKISGIGIEL